MVKWVQKELGSIVEMTSGGTPSKKHPEYYGGTIPWVRSGELENNIIMKTELCISESGLANSNAKLFPKGTLLIALYGATIGKLAFLGIDACTNQAVCGLFKNDIISNIAALFVLVPFSSSFRLNSSRHWWGSTEYQSNDFEGTNHFLSGRC